MRFIKAFLFLVFFATLIFPTTAFSKDNQKSYKIGFILSLTGAWGHFGEAQRHALEMAREDRSELFKNVSFIYEDCQYISKNAVTAFNKLVNINKVDAIFVWGVEPSLVLAPLAESLKVPLFVSALDPSAAIKRKYVIRTINYAAQHSTKLIDYLASKNFNDIAIVKSEISFFDILVNGLSNNLSEDQKLTIVDNYLPGQLDFRSTITKLKKENFDALGVYLGPDQVSQFFKQASEQDLKLQFFGATPFQSNKVIRDAKGAMQGAYFAHNYVSEDFREKYRQRVGEMICKFRGLQTLMILLC